MAVTTLISALPGRINSIPPRRILLAGAVLAVLASFILYRPVLGNGFLPSVAREDQLLVNAVRPYGLAKGWVYFRPHFWQEHISQRWVYYRPVLLLSHAADYALWGIRPPLSRCVNLLLHCLNVVLFAALVSSVLKRRESGRPAALPISAMAACLFFFLPASAEAISWIAARGDLLCASFALACMLALVTWGNTGQTRWAALSVLFTLLALGTKETSVILPALAAAAAIFLRQRSRPARLTLCILTLACLIGYILFRSHAGIILTPPNVARRMDHSARMFGYYVSTPLTRLFEAAELRDIRRTDLSGLAQTAALALLLLQCPGPAAAFLAWKVAFYLPVLGFEIVEPRYFYLPAMGSTALIALVCWQGYALCRRAAVHLSPIPLMAWAWILARYAGELLLNIRHWTAAPG